MGTESWSFVSLRFLECLYDWLAVVVIFWLFVVLFTKDVFVLCVWWRMCL